ncbi:HlyD family type I secretion periplasmic adaptor subunit [Brevundimonas nasdae]|jgi:HlyD family secretion protein|uniref:HlyD family type I secretion periplasmic adaptor subunit n=1 Tax=Brevundimonas nasdae TaxID=172043 RepID=A0ACD4VLG6_9CAUL|nr:HlyD family type I secretion periplasmic adaptor subunit [Brevundimonas nasdae]WOB78817.1 HlyD family type I secretion periplasmic adaptor subunit [Brevundimonas nasdae]
MSSLIDTMMRKSADDAPDSPRPELMLGIGIIVVFFVGFLGWAAFAPLDAGAFAQGQVSVSGNRQAVQHRDGGVVGALMVAEGDKVRRGQVLVRLNAGELNASERGAASQVFALLAQRSRLIAERDRLPTLPIPPEFAGLPPEDQALADEAMRLQRLQYAARGAGRSTETGVLNQRIGQLRDQMDGYERQIEANATQQRLIAEELEGLRSLAAQGYAPLTRVRALERTAAALEGEQGSLRAQVARTREQIGEARLQTLGVSTKLNEDVAEQLRQVEIQLNDLRPKMIELRDQLARAEIRSPATGQVVGLSVFTPGGVIQPGQTLMEIVPDEASQVIVAQVDPADIDNLRVGLDTEVKFPGLRERNPPIVHGRVTRISADSFTDEKTGRSHYRAEVVVPQSELEKLGSAARSIRAGMPVQVVMLTRKRTVLAYLVEPLVQSLWRSGSEQ